MSRSRRVGPAPNCPHVELAASSWPRRIGGAESAAPSCPRPFYNLQQVFYRDYCTDERMKSFEVTRHYQLKTSQVECDQVDSGRLILA